MGSKNAVSKAYLSDRKRFAQICNNQLFGGKPVISPELLRELDAEELLVEGQNRKELNTLEKYSGPGQKPFMKCLTFRLFWLNIKISSTITG